MQTDLSGDVVFRDPVVLDGSQRLRIAPGSKIVFENGIRASDYDHVFEVADNVLIQIKNVSHVTPNHFGAKGRLDQDQTVFLRQSVSSGANVFVPPGDYSVANVKRVAELGPKQSFVMSPGAWIREHESATFNGTQLVCVSDGCEVKLNADMGNPHGRRYYWGVVGRYDKPARDVVVSGCDLKNMGVGVRADNACGWRVFGNKIRGIRSSGILCGTTDGNRVHGNSFLGNIIENCGDTAIAFFSLGGFGGKISNNVVSGNIANFTQLKTDGFALDIESNTEFGHQYGNSFTGNSVNQQGNAVPVDGERLLMPVWHMWLPGDRIIVDDIRYYVIEATQDHIRVSKTFQGAPEIFSAGQVFITAGYQAGGIVSGDRTENTTITGNVVAGSDNYYFSQGIVAARNRCTSICGNSVFRCVTGINVQDIDGAVITGNQLNRNGGRSPVYSNLHLGKQPKNVVVSANHFGSLKHQEAKHIYYSSLITMEEANIAIGSNVFS